MSWFKVDDGFHKSRKVMKIRRSQRLAAVGLWTIAGSWCADELTDGHVPDYMLDEFGAAAKTAEALVTVGLWDRVDDGYRFHDWFDYQPTREAVLKKRDDEAKRKAEWRARKAAGQRGMSQQVSQWDNDGTDDGTSTSVPQVSQPTSALPDPTRPDPTPTKEEANASSRPRKRGTRITEDWIPDEPVRRSLAEQFPQIDLKAQHAKFIDHWLAKSGKDAAKLDWNAAFRNWIRNAAEWSQPRRLDVVKSQPDDDPYHFDENDPAAKFAAMGRISSEIARKQQQ